MQRRNFFVTAGVAAAGTCLAGTIKTASAQETASNSYVLPVPEEPSLPVVGVNRRFPIRRIYCIGRNYLAHIEELKHDRSQPPLFFQKQRDMLVQSGASIAYPSLTHDYEHEIELVLAMKSGGMNIKPEDAMQHVYGYAVGLDMTRRDLQNHAQEIRGPWEAGKSFDQSAPCSAVTPIEKRGVLKEGRIHLTVNNATATDGDLKNMIWNQAEVIAHLSTAFAIGPGDLIYTGTPAGVGKVKSGDKMVATIEGLSTLVITIS